MSGDTAPLELRDYLALLWRRKWIIAAMTIVAVGAALFYSYRQIPVYTSSAEVVVRPIQLEPAQSARGTTGFVNMETETRVANSGPVAERALDELEDSGIEPGDVSASQIEESETLLFTATGLSPESAQASAQNWAEAYLGLRKEQALADLEEVRRPLEDQITVLGQQAAVQRRIIQENQESNIAVATTAQQRYAAILAEVSLLRQDLNRYISAGSLHVGEVLRAAPTPTAPANRNHVTTGGLALLVGMSLGVGVAYLRDRLDPRVRGTRELEVHSGGSVLALIPSGKPLKDNLPITMAEPASELADAYIALGFRLLRMAGDREIRTLVVTSSLPQEGKSSTVANLGVAMARSGKRIILVSADLRKPGLLTYFPQWNGRGLVDMVRDGTGMSEALSTTSVDNLWVLHGGSSLRGSSPLEIVSSDEMRRLLIELGSWADLVLIDTPPLLGAFDASALAAFADGVLFVADGKRASGTTVEQARRELELSGANVVGVAVNRYDPRDYAGYAYRAPYYRPENGRVLPPPELEQPQVSREER
ncbi:MAG TPA: polysaccharide biosynthesis tyrosine autokinase [Actinomycetota bacterium]